MKNALFIKGHSQYGAMRNYIDEIEIGFRLAGYHTIVLDTLEQSVQFQVDELIKYIKIDLVFTCNAMNVEFIKILPGARYVTYLCDHPASHSQRLMCLDEKAIVFTCDMFYAEYVKEFFPNIKCAVFIPLGGSYSKTFIPYHERKYGVVFTGTYQRPQKVYEENLASFQNEFRDIVKDTMETLVKDPNQRRDVCLLRILELRRVILEKGTFNEMCCFLDGAEHYARSYYRDKMIRALIEEGNIKVHVFGNGWEDFESDYGHNLCIEKGNPYVAQKMVANAKISINIMPWFKGGFQERIAAAMLSGTVAVTDGSLYIDENFTDGKELVVYSLEHLEELPDKVKWILEHPKLAEQVALQGKMRAEQEMTWQHRVFEMLNIISSCTEDGFSGYIEGKWGSVLRVPYERDTAGLVMAADLRNGLDEILALAGEIQAYGMVDMQDLNYLYTKFLYLYIKINTIFPEVRADEYMEDCIRNVNNDTLQDTVGMFVEACKEIRDSI